MVQPARIESPPTREYRLKMSYEEFLAWSDEDTHAEWVEGEVIVFMPPTIVHQDIIGFVYMLISQFVTFYDLGKTLQSPFEMRLVRDHISREPDLAFIANDNLHRLDETRLEGPADLVLEIVSKESVTRDRRKKYHEYAAAGVPEYWVIDPRPQQKRAYFYANTPARAYQPILPDSEDRIHSTVLPGFWLREEWLWQTPFPSLNRLLYEIIGEAYNQRMSEHLLETGGTAYVQRMNERLLETSGEAYAQQMMKLLLETGKEISAQQMIKLLLETGKETSAQQMIEQLRKRGFLPPEEKE
jgi:Uma2 family endonuclease